MTRDYVALAAQYQADVLSGAIPACKWVQLACQRNRRDLDRQGTAEFPYRFDPDKARQICLMAEMLPHIKGPKAKILRKDEQGRNVWNAIVLEPWQCWIFTTMFGWVREDTGLRRFRVGLILIPRKNSKSTMGAIIALYMLVADGEGGPEVYSAATTRDQAKAVAEIAWEMAKRSPSFCEYFGVRIGSETTRSLAVPLTAGKFMPLSADANSLDGLNVSCAVVDELHGHKTPAVWQVLDTGTGARLQPWLLGITTAGVDVAGICHQKLGYLEKILDGVTQDETFFGLNYSVDLQPHTAKMSGVLALEELDKLCSCECVTPTLIAKFWQEACVKHATTSGIGMKARRDVQSILTELSKRKDCATPAIANGDWTPTPNSSKPQCGSGKNGHSEISRESRLPKQLTEQDRKASNESSTGSGLRNTEFRENSTTDLLQSNADSARFVVSDPKLFTWITATAAALFEDSFVRSATAQLVFSEILKNCYLAHSPTCKARLKSQLQIDGSLSVQRNSDDVRDPMVQRKANPNYGISVQPDDLLRKVSEAQVNQAELNNVLTKHFNVWIRSESAWMTASTWQTCHDVTLTLESLKPYPLWIGVDLGETRDPSSLALLFKLGPESFAFIPKIYLPADVIAKSPTAEMTGWEKQAHLISTPGNEADYRRIQNDLLDLVKHFKVQEIDFDRRSARLMMQEIRLQLEPTMGRDRVEKFVLDIPQNVDTMDPAMKTVEAWVSGKKLQHDGNPMMAWMVSNVSVERDHKGQIYPRKAGGKDSVNKIDAAIALFTATSRAMLQQEAAPNYRLLVLGGR